MNLFIIDEDPIKAAQMQCDKHVNKMTTESAQMLSTVHRLLDGTVEMRESKSGKTKVKHYRHPDPAIEDVLYRVAHPSHPCTLWTMRSSANYEWHYKHFVALCDEYKYRYNRTHLSDEKLRDILSNCPLNIPNGELTEQALAMKANPECIIPNDVVGSYRAFYQTKQHRFSMKWTGREVPDWFVFDG